MQKTQAYILRYTFLVGATLLSYLVNAQVSTYPLSENVVITNFKSDHPTYQWKPIARNKFGNKDTLSLPFFDDFATSSIYPDSTKWLNNQVFINNQFPIYPPTFNVATFDVLDESGTPYNNTINKDYKSAGDSLISQPINLLTDTFGTPYSLADSIMFSFFFQPNGYGYHLNGEDSIRLFFKADNNLWFQVWSSGGVASSADFEHVIIPLLNPNYLHADFQFMFTTFSRQVGNANHWHVDYVLLDKDRKSNEDYYNDYAIQTTPTSLLKDYNSMPYEHYLVNPSSHMLDSVYVYVSNLYNLDKNILISHKADYNGSSLVSTSPSANSNNVLAQNNAERRLAMYSITGLVGNDPIVINRTIAIEEDGVLNENEDNDKIEAKQIFHDYYAYDDGTAERGFGFDHNTNPSNIEGEIAYKFTLEKEDTLYAIGTFFNQSVYDVSGRRFSYRIWKSLAGVDGSPIDSIIYVSEEQTPEYNDENGRRAFSAHMIDSTLLLSPGTYFIGWHQKTIYNLNVGWDMNFGNRRNPNTKNPNLYYKIFGTWSNADLPNGTLMMRPHFGATRELYANLKEVEKESSLKIYPNPASSKVYLDEEYKSIKVINSSGLIVLEKSNTDKLDVSNLSNGMYFVLATNNSGELF
ncbi:MAG: T9SS type A sorting domain-containing protein, partial [Bacteroidia bacterium]|nr:T9SS type A sorting domain-containing protein [Bacteroidia bacterium]